MSLRYIRPVKTPAITVQGISFWPVPAGTAVIDLDYCLTARWEVAEAIRRATASGVVEYHVGSRGLRRFSLKELQDLYAFWSNAANDAAVAGAGSAIQSRRVIPCDR
jgi:hypothetical protein